MLHTLTAILLSLGEPAVGGPTGLGSAARTGGRGDLILIEGRGQWPIEAELVGRLGPLVVRLERGAIALQLRQGEGRGALVRLSFEGASGPTELGGRIRRPEHYSYFLGNDPSQWQRAVPAWEQALYLSVWPGVDLLVRADGERLKYDLLVEAGADLERATFAVAGAQGMHVDADEALVIETAAGPIAQPAPSSYEVLPSGERRPVIVRFRLADEARFGFEAEGRDPSLPLVIDPGLIWSSYLGSGSVNGVGDRVQAIALGPGGETIAAGIADWGDFPVTPGAYSSPFVAGEKAFVSAIDSTGTSLLYSCIVGGNQPALAAYTRAQAVGVDATGHAVVAGWTSHADFPTTPGAFDTQKDAFYSSAFVFKLEPDGSELVYSTFLEGSQSEESYALAVAPSGAAVVGGLSVSQDFPTTAGSFDTVHGPGEPAFLCRLAPSGDALEWSTFLGNSATTLAIELDEAGTVYATGTTGPGFPVTPGSFDSSYGGEIDGFILKLSPDGKNLMWGTYVGGYPEDRPNAIALDPSGNVVVGGRTKSFNFPVTPGTFQTEHSPGGGNNFDMFVTKVNSSGSDLAFSTYLGGPGWEEAIFGVALDSAGIVTFGGVSGLPGITPTPGAYDTVAYNLEGLVGRLSSDGQRLLYWSFLGEEGTDQLQALAMDGMGVVTVGGWTTGPWPLTPGCFDPTYNGGQRDGMVTRMDLLPTGAIPYGSSTPACYGPVVIGVTEMPAAGSSTFALYASGAPPGAFGVLGFGPAPIPRGLPLAGFLLLVDPGTAPILFPALAQSTPYAEVPVPIPPSATGLAVYAQFVFLNTAICGGLGTISATNALALTVQ